MTILIGRIGVKRSFLRRSYYFKLLRHSWLFRSMLEGAVRLVAVTKQILPSPFNLEIPLNQAFSKSKRARVRAPYSHSEILVPVFLFNTFNHGGK